MRTHARKPLLCWNQMQLEILPPEMWWANTCRRIVSKACPGRGIMGAKVQPGVRGAIVLWENDKQPVGAEWHRLCLSSAAMWEAAAGNFLVGTSQLCFIWFNPSHHYKALIARFEILKETRCLPLLPLSVIPDHPAGHSSTACMEQTSAS